MRQLPRLSRQKVFLALLSVTPLAACAGVIGGTSEEADDDAVELTAAERAAAAASQAPLAGAWWVDSPQAVQTLEARGYNLFHLPAGYLDEATFRSTLSALGPQSRAIVMLQYFSAGGQLSAAKSWVSALKSATGYAKVLGFMTFEEPNCGAAPVPTAQLASWYTALKAVASDKSIFVDFCVTDCGVPNPGSVSTSPGVSFDVAVVNFYASHWGWDAPAGNGQTIGEARLDAAAAGAKSYFASSTPIWPVLQAAQPLLRCCSYDRWTLTLPEETLVYLDPPYLDTTGYNVGDWDRAATVALWRWAAARAAEGAAVFVSEYSGPPAEAAVVVDCVWEKEVQSSVGDKSNRRTERLFRVKGYL